LKTRQFVLGIHTDLLEEGLVFIVDNWYIYVYICTYVGWMDAIIETGHVNIPYRSTYSAHVHCQRMLA